MKLFRLSTNIFRQNTNIINNHRSVSSLSSEYYTCEKKYEIERRSILGSSWQCKHNIIIFDVITYNNIINEF